jgi:hypothetical protein
MAILAACGMRRVRRAVRLYRSGTGISERDIRRGNWENKGMDIGGAVGALAGLVVAFEMIGEERIGSSIALGVALGVAAGGFAGARLFDRFRR